MQLLNEGRQFQKQFTVAEYECDTNGRIKPGYLLRHMQQVSGEHLDALGLPYIELFDMGQVFLLSKILLDIARLPMGGEPLTLTTTPKTPIGAQFIRTNEFFDKEGARILRADTTWLLVNPKTRKILRPKEFGASLLFTQDALPCPLVKYRVAKPERVQQVGVREIRYSDLDVNRHMNNAAYADIICDFLPEGVYQNGRPSSLFISFQNEARLGELLTVSMGEETSADTAAQQEYYIIGEKENGCCFEALLRLEKEKSAKTKL